MTDILCSWLNNEVKLSTKIDGVNFAREFANGFLIGEVLEKYQLQNDFDQFSQNRSSDSKLNNFTRLEPVLHLLEIPFDTNIARDVMTEKHGVATRLMYQLFVALNKKVKNNLTGVAMETMRPAAPVKLEGVESLMYKERLKHMTPRQTDLNLEALLSTFHQKQIEMEATAFKERFEDQERYQSKLQEQRQELMQKYRDNRAKKSEMLAKIQAATVNIPKPPANRTAKAIAQRRDHRRRLEAQSMAKDLDSFEDKLKRTLPPSKPISEGDGNEADEVAALPDSLDLIKPSSNNEYIGKIRKRLNEDSQARSEREKRRRKVLVDQLKAHNAQEEARREEMLVNRLMRQSQQERRIAVQLLQTRHEKEVIRGNRLMREKQYEDQRLQEFEEAMNREAEMARLAKLEYIDQTQKDRELHDHIMAERAEARYRKHYAMCGEILGDVVDFTCKVGEYRELTNKLLPEKLMREWTALFVSGMPLYEVPMETMPEEPELIPEQVLEEERQLLLDEGDFNEYRNMMGEWQAPESSELSGPPRDNPIVGHIVQRLFDIVHPPSPPPPPPEFPPFPIKACVLGKVFSGKSSVCKKLAENHRIQVLEALDLVNEAMEAHKNGEVIEIEEEPEEELPPFTAQSEAAPPSAQPGTTPATADSATASDQPTNADAEVSKVGSAKPSEIPSEAEGDNKTQEETSNAATQGLPEEEGKEKSDPEKPVPDEDAEDQTNPVVKSAFMVSATKSPLSKTKNEAPPKPQATPRAKLGAKALRFMKRGKAVDDSLMVDIIIEAIKCLPEGTGWILDGFPSNYAQAKLLEKALTGVEAQSREPSKVNLKEAKGGKGKKSQLAPDPRPAPPPQEAASGINVIILFDIPNELALKRSAGRTVATQEDKQYQMEFNPPPEGSATGMGKQERVVPVEDVEHDQEQCQHRLTAFQDAWPKMEKWFSRFGTLKKVDAAQESASVYLEVENVLEETMKKLQGGGEEETPVEETPKEEEKVPEPEKLPEPEVPVEAPKEEDRSRPSSRKSRGGSAKRSGSRGSSDKGAKGKKEKTPSRTGSKSDSAKKSGKGSRGSSPKSPKRKGSGKKGKSPEPEPEPEPEVPSGPPPPEPGSDEWEYVDLPIEEELAHIITPQWDNVESTYISSNKVVFRKVRDEREEIIRYFYSIRQDFLDYLKRPDHKQEFVGAWQKEFNEIPDDVREDEETRAELHERVDDVRERLWTICDDRKEQAEKERENMMADGWVEDHLGILSNHYISLMQNETDRYQDTVRMLKDYYRAMEGKIPDEITSECARIPLIELPATERPQSPTKSETGSQAGDGSKAASPAPGAEEPKATLSKSTTPSGGRKKKGEAAEENQDGEEERKPRIPLVPRRPVSPDPTTAAGGKGKGDKGKTSKAATEDTPMPPMDPDEKLVFDAHQTGVAAIDKIVLAEQAAKEAEEEAERQREAEREAEKLKAAAAQKKGGKKEKGGKKSRSPSPKKGKGKETPTAVQPTPPPEEESPEEKEKKVMREKARKEFFAAISEEATAAKTRMDLVKAIANSILADLKTKADGAYKDMNDWLGARFLKEMESIDHMSEVMRHAIEYGTKVQEELLLKQEDFLVNNDIKVLKTPSPVPRPPPIEDIMPETFTVEQIMSIYTQFQLTAPSGMLSLKAFQDVFLDLASLTHGTETLPEIWTALTPEKLETMSVALSPDGQYIDWRAFLLQAAHPWPVPSQSDLLLTLDRFRDMDQKSTGKVTREQFKRVELWFREGTKPPSPTDPIQPLPYDRLDNLKMAFFDLFADFTEEPPQIDYVDMLLYFSVAPDPYEGFLRALSVAAGSHMPRLAKKIVMRKPSRPSSQASLAVSVDLEVERPTEEETPAEDVPEDAINSTVPLDSLDRVLHHGQSMRGDSHRFSVTSDPEDAFSRERLAGVYQEVGSSELEAVPFSVLAEHPVMQDIISNCTTYRAIDLKSILNNPGPDALMDLQSLKTAE